MEHFNGAVAGKRCVIAMGTLKIAKIYCEDVTDEFAAMKSRSLVWYAPVNTI